jgi:hypothetical protein
MLEFEVIPDRHVAGDWRVEWLLDPDEGTMAVVIFSGPGAEDRAREYAAWKSAGVEAS